MALRVTMPQSRDDMYQRKKSLMAGHTKHNIDDVVSTLKRECSKLEETFI